MSIQNDKDLRGLQEVGAIIGDILNRLSLEVCVGSTTARIDRRCGWLLDAYGAQPTPKSEYGFPGNMCISVNDEAVHGVPSGRVIRKGDLVKLDLEAEKGGYVADATVQVLVGPADPLSERLVQCAENAFWKSLEVARAGQPIIAVSTSHAYTESDGWTVRTQDGSLSAHFEHTVIITDGEPIILTAA